MGKTRVSGGMALVLAACLAGGLAVGCQQQERRQAQLVQSDLLIEELAVALAESMMARQEAGEELPEDYDSSEFAESVIDSMLMQHPEAFAVTPEEERRMREQQFDDERNLAMSQQILQQLREHDASLGTITAHQAEQVEAGELSGGQLELATRLLSAELSSVLGVEGPFLDEAPVEAAAFEEAEAEQADEEAVEVEEADVEAEEADVEAEEEASDNGA